MKWKNRQFDFDISGLWGARDRWSQQRRRIRWKYGQRISHGSLESNSKRIARRNHSNYSRGSFPTFLNQDIHPEDTQFDAWIGIDVGIGNQERFHDIWEPGKASSIFWWTMLLWSLVDVYCTYMYVPILIDTLSSLLSLNMSLELMHVLWPELSCHVLPWMTWPVDTDPLEHHNHATLCCHRRPFCEFVRGGKVDAYPARQGVCLIVSS